jgi:hypothetical protein
VTFQDDTELKANKSLLLKHFGLLAELLDGEEDLETDGDADLESNPTHTAWAVAYAQVLDVEPFTVSGVRSRDRSSLFSLFAHPDRDLGPLGRPFPRLLSLPRHNLCCCNAYSVRKS